MSNSKRFDMCSPRARTNSDKPYWHKVGSAFENEKGTTLLFDSLPLPDQDGRVVVMLFEPKDKDDRPQRGGDGRGERRQSYDDRGRDDDVPGWN